LPYTENQGACQRTSIGASIGETSEQRETIAEYETAQPKCPKCWEEGNAGVLRLLGEYIEEELNGCR
jgi:hypothetical protein